MTMTTYKCWYASDDEDPSNVTASSAHEAALGFAEMGWEGGGDQFAVCVRDGDEVTRWKVNVAVPPPEITARRLWDKP